MKKDSGLEGSLAVRSGGPKRRTFVGTARPERDRPPDAVFSPAARSGPDQWVKTIKWKGRSLLFPFVSWVSTQTA